MSADCSKSSPLACLVDLAVQLQRDAQRPEPELHRRDRELLRPDETLRRDRRALLAAWLDAMAQRGGSLPGRRVATLFRLLLLALVVGGLAVGWGTASVVFYYDGTRPVNVVHVLAVFVGAQLLLLALLGIVALPQRLLRFVPGAVAVQEALSWLSPGQVIRLAIRALPRSTREHWLGVLQRSAVHQQTLGRVLKWAIVFGGQTFAVAFNVGALLAALYLVTFSDLAFAWSTTLQPDVATVHQITSCLAAPWAKWWPEAVPSQALIEQTLYYRQSGPPRGIPPERWGQWWPFLLACMVTYGLLPRLLLLVWAGLRFRSAVRRACVELPGVAVVLDRLTTEWVSSQSLEPETDAERPAQTLSAQSAVALANAGAFALVNWGGLDVNDEALARCFRTAWKRPVCHVCHAGGRCTLEQDAQTIETLASLPADTAVAVVVKAWEPPVLEVLDFLQELRARMGPQRLLVLTPVALDPQGLPHSPSPEQLGPWQRKAATLGDPALVVRPWPETLVTSSSPEGPQQPGGAS